ARRLHDRGDRRSHAQQHLHLRSQRRARLSDREGDPAAQELGCAARARETCGAGGGPVTLRRRRDIWDLVVIGGGIAGLTAAWHAMRRGLATALFEPGPGYGGQVATVNSLDDWP